MVKIDTNQTWDEPFEVLLHAYAKKYGNIEISGFIVSERRYRALEECIYNFNIMGVKLNKPLKYRGIDVYPSSLIPDDEVGCITMKIKINSDEWLHPRK